MVGEGARKVSAQWARHRRGLPPLWLAALALASGCQAIPGLARLGTPADAYVPGQVLVKFKAGATASQQAALQQASGVTTVNTLPDGSQRWILPASASVQAIAGRLAAIPTVAFAEPDHLRHLQGFTASDSDLTSNKQWHLNAIQAPQAWSTYFSATNLPGHGVMVAVVDSGVDPNHPDLKANLLPLIDELPAGSDTYNGTDYTGKDGNGHGTHVTGILAAVANNTPFTSTPSGAAPGNCVGVAPGATILPIKVMRADGSGDDFTIAKGMEDAVTHGAKVINLSIGGSQTSQILAAAIVYGLSNGVTMVMAAGNEGGPVDYPAAYPGVIPVGALDSNNQVPSYVSNGPQLAIAAPGGSIPGNGPGIWSTLPTYACYETLTDGNTLDYGYLSGTSMATPMVAAAAAMILQESPGLTPAQVRARLVATTDSLGAPYSELYGYGRLDVMKALQWTSADGSGQ